MNHARLNELLKQQDMSGYRLAKDTGIDQVSIWKYRRGKASPRVENLKKIAKALNVKVDDLL